jgi:putative hemolysin
MLDTEASKGKGFYSETEFNLQAILGLEGRMLEVGRTCVRADWRGGATIAVLWSGLGGLVRRHKVDYLFGCASILMDGGFGPAIAIMDELRRNRFAPPHVRVQPLFGLPANARPEPGPVKMPPLLATYLRLGAMACGEAYWDRDFNMADVFMLLRVEQMHPRYAKHFLGTES